MGGINSGRQGRFPTAEACGSLILPMQGFMGRLEPGMQGSGSLTFRSDGEPLRLKVAVAWPRSDAPHVMMTHPIRAEDGRTISYRIDLERTPCRFGGWRWWWLCPATGRRAHKLFLPRGGQRFLSRPAYRLGYASQRLDPLGKLQHSKWLIIRKLGGDWDMPIRPKGMRRRTYGRLLDRLEDVELRLELCFQAGIERLMARYEKLG
jgi:hypothetical protein